MNKWDCRWLSSNFASAEYSGKKDSLALTIYLRNDEIGLGIKFGIPFSLSVQLLFFTLHLWWQDMSREEMLEALRRR